MFTSNFNTIRYLYYINILISILFLMLYGISIEQATVISLIFCLMNPLGIAVSYHRYWSHKSFEWKNQFYKQLCTLPAIISGVGSILGWVGLHRRHHIFSDVDGDPHRASKGFWSMMLMTSYDYKPNPREVIDLMRDRYIVITHNYYFVFPLIWVVLLSLVFGLEGVVVGYCIPAALSLMTQNLTNYVNHFGDKYSPKNVGWINCLNFGDGWHANHHKNPSKYTTSQKWWQFDPAGLMIKYVFAKSVKT